MEMINYEMSEEMENTSVDWLGDKHADIIAYLKKHGITTLGEVVDHEDSIPEKFYIRIKAKIVFGIDM